MSVPMIERKDSACMRKSRASGYWVRIVETEQAFSIGRMQKSDYI